MTILGDVFKELLGMFRADAKLTTATLFLVAIVGGLSALRIDPFAAGCFLLFSCLAILVATATSEARADR